MDRRQLEYFERTAYSGADDPVARIFVRSKIDWFARRVRLQGARVLELGAGPGIFSAPLATQTRQLVATDAVRSQLRDNPVRQRVVTDAAQLPFADRAFDLVLIANLLHHLADPIPALTEAGRVSREAVLLVEPNGRNPAQAAFSTLVPEERGGLRFNPAYLENIALQANLFTEAIEAFGVLTQNRTPLWFARLFGVLDRPLPGGLYLLALMLPAADRAFCLAPPQARC